MPALTGEPWRGRAEATVRQTATPTNGHVAVVSFDSGLLTNLGDGGTWQGDAGTSLTLRFAWARSGEVLGSGQQAPDNVTIDVRIPGTSTVIGSTWSPAFPAETVEVTRTWHFDSNPLNGTLDAVRDGTLEIYFTWGAAGGALPWSADSRGANTGLLAANEVANARGYARGRKVANAHSISNVAIGGVEPALWAADDPVHMRLTTTQSYRALAPTLALTVPGGATERSGASASTVGPNFDWSFTALTGTSRRLGSGMVLAAALKDIVAILPSLDFGGDNETAWTTSGHEAGWTRVSDQQMSRGNRITVDPRITVDHHLQVDNGDFATPPGSRDVNPKQILATDLPFTGARLLNARGEGLNSVVYTETLRDAGNVLAAAISRSDTTVTRGGQVGWSATLASTQQVKPGGAYNHTVDITTAHLADIEANPTETYTLLAPNPAFAPIVFGGPVNQAEHVYAGKAFQAGVFLLDTSTWRRAAIVSAVAAIIRLQDSGVDDGFAEYLAADLTWQPLPNQPFSLDAIHTWTLAETRTGSNVFLRTWSAVETAGWGDYDLFVVARAVDATGAPYGDGAKEIVVGPHHSHSARAKNLQWLGIPA